MHSKACITGQNVQMLQIFAISIVNFRENVKNHIFKEFSAIPILFCNTSIVLDCASEVGSPKNHLGSGQRQDMGPTSPNWMVIYHD